MKLNSITLNILVACSLGTLAACSSDSTTPAPETTTSISGSVFASNVNGAEVSGENISGTTIAGPVTTASDGSYSIEIPDSALASDLVFRSTGGLFDDEATSAVGVAAGAMAAHVAGGSLAAGDAVHVTPGTTIHAGLVSEHGKDATAARTTFFQAFAYHPDTSTEPVDITTPEALTASDVSRMAGHHAAVLSQLAQNLNLAAADQFDLFAALAQDLSDDTLDGVDADGAVAIGSTGTNLPPDILAQYIAAAASFTDVETASYQISYADTSSMTNHGKEQFTLSITDKSDGTPVTGLVSSGGLSMMPMMYMADMTHSTPFGDIVETAPGEYEATIYYLMPSRMMDTTMGTWDLKAMVNMESAHFYPNVMMAMGDTVRVQLKGVDDTIIDMNGLEVPRTYNLFKEKLEGTNGDYQFDVFIAPIETMMSFPPLEDQMTLQSGMGGTPLLVDGITVEISIDDGVSWTNAQDQTKGIWSITNLNLQTGVETDIRVRLTVSGETKTTVSPEGDVIDYGTFTVTP